jgi:hypothetical protein
VTRLGLDGHGQVAKERNGGDAHQQLTSMLPCDLEKINSVRKGDAWSKK